MADLRGETWIESRRGACRARSRRRARRGLRAVHRLRGRALARQAGPGGRRRGVTLIPSVALATVREDVVLRSLGATGRCASCTWPTQACGYRAPAVEPMKAILRQVAAEHCFECAARVGAPAAAA